MSSAHALEDEAAYDEDDSDLEVDAAVVGIAPPPPPLPSVEQSTKLADELSAELLSGALQDAADAQPGGPVAGAERALAEYPMAALPPPRSDAPYIAALIEKADPFAPGALRDAVSEGAALPTSVFVDMERAAGTEDEVVQMENKLVFDATGEALHRTAGARLASSGWQPSSAERERVLAAVQAQVARWSSDAREGVTLDEKLAHDLQDEERGAPDPAVAERALTEELVEVMWQDLLADTVAAMAPM